jgi:hypothetical protein
MFIRDQTVRTVPATIAVTALASFVLGVARAQDLTPQVMHVPAPEFPPTAGLESLFRPGLFLYTDDGP